MKTHPSALALARQKMEAAARVQKKTVAVAVAVAQLLRVASGEGAQGTLEEMR